MVDNFLQSPAMVKAVTKLLVFLAGNDQDNLDAAFSQPFSDSVKATLLQISALCSESSHHITVRQHLPKFVLNKGPEALEIAGLVIRPVSRASLFNNLNSSDARAHFKMASKMPNGFKAINTPSPPLPLPLMCLMMETKCAA